MNLSKKLLTILISVLTILQFIPMVYASENVNAYPPVRPSVGNMKVDVSPDEQIVVGLRTDGTINFNVSDYYFSGADEYEFMRNDMLALRNIVDVACSNEEIFALKSDGTLFVGDRRLYMLNSGKNYGFSEIHERFIPATGWADVVAIEAGSEHIAALKSDGTVVAAGGNSHGQCNTVGWNNISKIVVDRYTTIGIKKDGTVMVAGQISNMNDVRKYKNVIDVYSVNPNINQYIAVLNDGTVTYTETYVPTVNGNPFDKNGKSVRKDMTVDEIFSYISTDTQIVDIESCYSGYYILDSLGDMYGVYDNGDWSWKKLVENADRIVNTNVYDYYTLDYNGQIWSNTRAFTSDDWVLTTNITLNGDKIKSDVAPYVYEGRTLGPIRAILEALGMTVTWDDPTQTATAVKDGITIKVTIGSNTAYVNGESKVLDVSAQITNGRTFVPVRFFAEALGMNVDWDGYTKTVIITQ